MSLFRKRTAQPPITTGPDREGHPPADETGAGDSTVGVPGERGIPPVTRARSVQSRVASVLTVTLLCALATGLLVWYYSGAINRSGRAQELAAAAAKRRAQGESTPLPLGAIIPPKLPGAEETSPLKQLVGPPAPIAVPEVPASPPPPLTPAGPPKKTPAELELERRLGGPVLSSAGNDRAPLPSRSESSIYGEDAASTAQLLPTRNEASEEGGSDPDSLGALLKPTATPAVRARVLPTQRFLLPKGAFIDCTLETAISSALPGMTTCVTATDTFSADGTVVLLERGSKLVGETRGQVQQGKPRLFVLWTEARTPEGVVVPLASPGTDELGRSGLSGEIDRHWWLRFGTAILITVIDGAVQGLTERSTGSTIVINPSTSSQVATEVLRDTVHIPPTLEKPQGDRIQILVARDVDFRSVYSLNMQGVGE
jgi:type IV secretion system protein VirB10